VRVQINYEPFVRQERDRSGQYSTLWPARWVSCPDLADPPFVSAYRLSFAVAEPTTVRTHVTADERYELFLDGQRLGRGPERGDPQYWFFETYDLDLAPGEHVLVARVWSLGRGAPTAQMTVRPGFLLAAEPPFTDLLSTGTTSWTCQRLRGYEFLDPGVAWGTGARLCIDAAAFAWNFQRGLGPDWHPVQVDLFGCGAVGAYDFGSEHLLRPALLPPMIEEPRSLGQVRHVSAPMTAEVQRIPICQADHLMETTVWQQLLLGENRITIPPGTIRRVLIDLQDYTTGFLELVTSDGAGSQVRLHWAEALYIGLTTTRQHHSPKGNRDEIEGKFFYGIGDLFLPDGGLNRHFTTLWWEAGRYIELVVQTADQPLVIERLGLCETRYPLTIRGRFVSDDPRLATVFSLGLRALQMCAHETYLDCPYYEQLMYVGDARLQALTTYALSNDDRLPRKAIMLFDVSRQTSGLTRSQYPSRVTLLIAPFSLWWVGMVHDYALWRDDPVFVQARLSGVRAVLDYFHGRRNADGLLAGLEGWNFTDWVPEWHKGVPPDGVEGVSGILNAQFVLVLHQAAELEAHFGEPELAVRNRRTAAEIGQAFRSRFWDEARGLFADDLAHLHFSEHAQCLALLGGVVDPPVREQLVDRLRTTTDLARTSMYFSHYLLEMYRLQGDATALFDRLEEWFTLAPSGFRTTREEPEPSRSDCHAWGAHPLYHFAATILGVRPAEFGFRSVQIAPLLGPLTDVAGTVPHPRGDITVALRVEGDCLAGTVTLPDRTTGRLQWAGRSLDLQPGPQAVDIRRAKKY